LGANRRVWSDLYAAGGGRLELPDENLVRLLRRTAPAAPAAVLDFGCGSGNNLSYLARHGYTCCGADLSADALAFTAERLTNEGVRASLVRVETELPFASASFDLVVSWHVLSYADVGTAHAMLRELRRVLRPGGCLLITMLRPNDVLVDGAERIDSDTYRVVRTNLGQAGAVIFAPATRAAVEALVHRFEDVSIGYAEWMFGGRTGSHWLVAAKAGAHA
jgi:SAM-dependent methyltransferase